MTYLQKRWAFFSAVGLCVFIVFAWLKIPKKSGAVTQGVTNQFPSVVGTSLARIDVAFPRDFAKPFNIVFIPFQQWQQGQVDSWVPFVQELEAERDDVIYYELPTVWEMNAAQRTFLNEGMRAGIPNETSRERTITLYLDKPAFREQLNMPSEDTMYILLVTQAGEVVWMMDGAFSAEKAQSLSNTLSAEG